VPEQSANPRDDAWLTVAETAEMLGISEQAVRKRIRSFKLPAQRLPGGSRAAWRVNRVALDRRLKAEAFRRRVRDAGIVVGSGADDDAFAEEVGRLHGVAADQVRAIHQRQDALLQAAQQVDLHSAKYGEDFARLEEAEAIEAAARRRAEFVRHEERIERRAREMLDEQDEQDEDV